MKNDILALFQLVLVIAMLFGFYYIGDFIVGIIKEDKAEQEQGDWVGSCISSSLNEFEYQRQYERAEIEKLKETCEFKGIRRDIVGCYGDDFYKFYCLKN